MVLSLSICALVFSVLATALSIYAVIQIEANKRSTHRLQYVGASPSDIDIEDELSNDSVASNINKKTKEELRETMPFFNNDETSKVRSL